MDRGAVLMRFATIVTVLLTSLSLLAADPAPRSIDTEKSTLTVRVFKTGLFSAFGHEHEIKAPISQGSFQEDKPQVEPTVDARKLRVMDKDVSGQRPRPGAEHHAWP